MSTAQVPDFGVLAGVRVTYVGSALAGPFAAQLMAEFGADVLWVENARSPDMVRTAEGGFPSQMERRNQRTLSLDLKHDEGRNVLLQLLADTEIFIESSRGGQFARWGLDDEVLWSANPSLVIVHVSGFGQDGDDRYVQRAAFDPIAQAFGCYLQLNGPAEGTPLPANPFTADYMTGLFACSASLAALLRARQTGQGDSIDVAMYEVLMRAGGSGPMEYLNLGIEPVRKGTGHVRSGGIGLYPCQDGTYLYVVLGGAGVLRRGVAMLGIEDDELFPESMHFAPRDSRSGAVLEQAAREFCASRPASDAEAAFSAAGVPCSAVYTYERALNDPHYAAREVFTCWPTVDGGSIKGVGVVPKFARRPGRVWRGAPSIGMDNEDILRKIGLTDEQIDALYKASVITREEK